jgi:hypothetical protein
MAGFSRVRLGTARQSQAGRGAARLGRFGAAIIFRFDFVGVRLGRAWSGRVRHGGVRLGKVWFGVVRQGSAESGMAGALRRCTDI